MVGMLGDCVGSRPGGAGLRWLTFSSLFPNAALPVHGVFVRDRIEAVLGCASGEPVVVAPVPWFPPIDGFGRWSRWGRVPRFELDAGRPVFHPRYPIAPRVSTSIHPLLMQAGAEWAVRRLAGGPRLSLIDAHFLYPDGVAAVRIGRRLGLPVVLTAHGSDVHRFARLPVPRAWIRSALAEAAAVIVVSRDLRSRLARLTGFPEERIEVIHNGVDRSRFRPDDRAAARQALGLPPDESILLAAGHFVPRKRYDLLLQALVCLEPARRPLLVCVGDGPDRAARERDARRAGLADRVRFVGEQGHAAMPRWYAAADRFALVSDFEGCPMVVLEAIACGRPVLVSPVGGNAEIVAPDVGVVVDQNAPAAIARGLDDLARRRFEPAAFERSAGAHSWDVLGDAIAAVFARVAAGPR